MIDKQSNTKISLNTSLNGFLRKAAADVTAPYFNLTTHEAGEGMGQGMANAAVGAMVGAAVAAGMNAGGPCGPENADMLVADYVVS